MAIELLEKERRQISKDSQQLIDDLNQKTSKKISHISWGMGFNKVDTNPQWLYEVLVNRKTVQVPIPNDEISRFGLDEAAHQAVLDRIRTAIWDEIIGP